MGQNQSYPDGTPASNSGDSENNNSSSNNNNNNNNNSSSSNNNNNNNNNNQTSGSSETSEEASTRDGSEKRGGGGINQAQSVRAAIDTLIESCLVAKDDGMNGETVKAPAVGYTLEQLAMPKEDPESSETSLGSTENKSSTKEKDKEKEKSSDKEESKNSKETRPTTPPKTFGSFMEKSIIELITKGEEEQEELFLIGTKGQKEKSPSEGSVKHIGSVSDRKNSSEQTKSAAGDKTVGKTDSGVKSDPPSTTKPVRTLPKRTVRLQTLIDTVLDNSLAQEMPSAYERRKSEALINDLLISRCDPSLKSVSQTEPVTSKSDIIPRPEAKENKMVHLMDHIEKVLEKNLEASCDDSDDDSSHLRILNRLSWESPPMTSSGSTPAASLSSSSSTTSSAHHNDSSPRTKQQQQHQQQHDLQSRASSGSNSSEGTISVQDIVDRVISQTEVISKLLSPGDPASAARAAGKDSGKHTTTTTTSNVVGSCCSSQPICSQAANATKPEQLSRSPQNLHARSPQNQPQSGSHGTEGHSQKSLDHSPRGRPRASTYDSHQMWMLRHAQDSRTSVGHPSSEKNSSDFRQLDSSSSSGEGLHNISKNNKSVLSPAFGSGPGPGPGPLVMPPYVNTLASTSGIVSFAQSPVFRPPGHQMFVPRYPVPLLRVEMASDSAQALPPHPPSSSCLCVACVGKFRLDEHSPKHGLLGPVTSTSSSGMLSPHGQMDSSYYQQRMAGAAGQHNPFMMRDYSRPAPNSPGRHGLPSPAQMPGVASKQGVVGQTPKTVHYPPPHVGGFAHDSEFHGFTSYEKQKLEVLKSERGFPSPHLQHVSIQNPFETPHNDSVYNPVDPSFLHSRLEASFQRAEDAARGGKYESLAEKKLHSMSSPAQVAMYDDSRRDRVHGGSPILDLSVKKTGLSRPYSEKPSSAAPVLNEPMDEPLDLSKKTAQPSFTSEHNNKRQELRIQKSESFGFRRPEASVKQEVNNKAHHLDGSPGRYGHSQQRDVHPYPGASPSSSLFSMNARLPRQAEMAPNVNPNMLLSAGGQRPQLHPLPAPSLATSLMPSSTATMLQTYMSHAQAAVLPNHSGDPSADQRSKPQPSSGHATRTGESATHKPQRESPQLDSPDNSPLDKDDVAGRRSCSGRNEPIQSIIGNHNPNDILYLICRICRQSNGSPYAFRKHFRNHHGFEPKAEHTIVQTISATKSARQNPYASNGPGGEGVQFSGNESAEEQRSSLSSSSSSSNSSRKPNFKTESHVSSDSHPADNIPSPNDAGNRHQKSRGRSPAEARQRDGKDSREDTKCLECPECKQTFQLNDFGSYKRHCRQHNQSRGSGSFVACDLSTDPQDAQVEKMQGGITMCKICGVPFSAHYIDDHVRSVHGFFCSQCPEVFKTSDDLQSHLRSAHSNHFLPANAAAAAVANANVPPGSSPSTRMSPRVHSPSRASLPSSSPNLSSSPHPRRSPSRSGHSSSTTPSPGNASQKSGRDTQSSPGDVVVCVAAASKSSSATAAAAAAAAVPTNRISTSESSGYGSISSTCEIERVPADNLTISASPDSSSDNVNKRSPSLCVLSDITVSSCSLATPDDRSRVTSAKGRGKGDDDMDSTVSGSPTTDMVIDVSTVDGGETQPPNFFYKHKKFGGHRKRAESSDSSEVSANKVAKYGKDDASSAVSGHSVNDDSSSNSSCSSLKGGEQEKADDSGSVTKEQTITAKPKVENKLKQEARHQLPFVWDRVTRIQAGKNIKPPDYMT